MDDATGERRRALMIAASSRLTPLRGNMTNAEFDQLLVDVVEMEGRFREIDNKPGATRADMPDAEIMRLLKIRPG